jgi:hypothetical protein
MPNSNSPNTDDLRMTPRPADWKEQLQKTTEAFLAALDAAERTTSGADEYLTNHTRR